MVEEKKITKKKIFVIIGFIVIIVAIGIVIWLLFLRGSKENYDGSWILKEIKPLNGTFKTTDKKIKIVVTNNKNIVLYENNIEKCQMHFSKNMTCSGTFYDVVDNTPINTLYLSDQNDNIYKFIPEKKGDIVLKQGFSITVRNWKIEEENGTIGHPSTEELNNINNIVIENDELTTITVPMNVLLSSPGEYIKYSFEMVNDGTEDLYINSSSIGYSSDDDISISEFWANIDCYTDENHLYSIGSEPSPFESGDKLVCEFNIENGTISDPTDITFSQSWTITKDN